MKTLRNLVSRKANKAMSDQETDNTETSNQTDISVASSSKQEDKTKKPNQGLKRSIQIEQEEIKEGETQEELEEITGLSDPLNLVFSYFDSRFQKIQNQVRKNKDKEPAGKKRKIQVETFKQKGHRLQREFNKDIMENLQSIIDNISDEQDPVSTSLKAVISKLKKRNKLIKIADSTQGGWAVVAEYEKEPIGSDSDDCRRIRQAETRALKKKNTQKSKSSAFKPSSTLWNPRMGNTFGMLISSTITLQQVVAADSIPSNTGRIRTSNIQFPAKLGNLGVKLRQCTTALDVVSKGIGENSRKEEKRKQSYHRR